MICDLCDAHSAQWRYTTKPIHDVINDRDDATVWHLGQVCHELIQLGDRDDRMEAFAQLIERALIAFERRQFADRAHRARTAPIIARLVTEILDSHGEPQVLEGAEA